MVEEKSLWSTLQGVECEEKMGEAAEGGVEKQQRRAFKVIEWQEFRWFRRNHYGPQSNAWTAARGAFIVIE